MTKPNRPSDSPSLRATAILIALVAVLYLAREILIPFAFAITLTLALSPAVTWLQKARLGRVPSVLLVMLISIAVTAGIGVVIFNQVIGVVNELPRYQQNIRNKIEAMRLPAGAFGRTSESLQQLGQVLTGASAAPAPNDVDDGTATGRARPQPVEVVERPPSAFQNLRDLTQPFLSPLASLGIVLIFSVFMLIEQDDLRNRLFRLAGLDRLNVMARALDDATRRVSRYLLLQIMVNACFGVVWGIGLYLIGLPYAVLWGTVAAILRMVPYVGPPAAALLPLLLSLAVFDGWMAPLFVFLLFAGLELVTSNLIEPWLYGIHTGISALALLSSAVFWAALWGPAGLILTTPLTVCFVVLGRYVPQLSFLHVLLGDEPALEAEALVYLRLLAMDEQGAQNVVRRYFSKHSLTQLYDSVFIPVLGMAEQDRHKGSLDPAREEFIFLNIKEMLAEFSEKTVQAEPGFAHLSGSTGRALCLPANDEADEITAAMLAQLLQGAGCSALAFPVEASLQHLVALVEPTEEDVFCISALPPFAFARARSLHQQLQIQFPKTKVVIGVWGFAGDTERALQRFQSSPPDRLVTSLGEAVKFVLDPARIMESAVREPSD